MMQLILQQNHAERENYSPICFRYYTNASNVPNAFDVFRQIIEG